MVDLLIDEVRGADLGDERLNNRLVQIVERFGQSPNLSIPVATTSRAEMEAACRFFNDDKVSSQKILEPHAARTLERMASQSVVVLVQDTTEIDLTRPSQPVKGAGPMDSESRRGEFFHPLMAFSSETLPSKTRRAFAGSKAFDPLEKPPRNVRKPLASASANQTSMNC